MNLQGKLLRVIQERELRRVGGVKSISLDIRILSATNRDLKQLVKRGEFREDLYYRLNVVDIFIPPLRARREDIQPLIFYYLNKYCKEYRVEKHISEETIGYLEGYPWPGNIREVRNLIENLIVSTINCEIKPFHLPVYIKEPSTGYHCEKQQIASQQNIEEMPGLRETLEQLEKKLITEALQKQGSIRKAATLLKIDHSTLIRKMKKYNVDKM
nr:sigma 54-interacting transcriptional regulator [Aneurinibacillus tyrosinisolvens]